METTIQRVRRIDAVRHACDATMSDLEAALVDLHAIRAFCDAADIDLIAGP